MIPIQTVPIGFENLPADTIGLAGGSSQELVISIILQTFGNAGTSFQTGRI